MAFALAQAYVEFSARGASGVMGQVDKIGSSLTSMKTIAAGALATLGGFVGIAGAGGLLKLAADAESTAVSFEVMLGSAEAAKKMLEDIQRYADASPFDNPDVEMAAKTLLNFQVAGENVMPVIDMLGNVASGSKEKLQSLAVVFGQVASNGKLMGGDLLQFINAGFNPLAILAEKTGESMASLRDRMSKGQIGIEEVAKAFEYATSEGGPFFQMNEKQAATLGSLWSTASATVVGILRDLSTQIVEKLDLKDALGGAMDYAAYIKANWVPSIVDGIVWVRDAIAGLEPTWNLIGRVAGFVGDLIVNVIPPIVVGVVDWIIANQELLVSLGLIVGVITGLPALIGVVTAGLSILGGAIALLMSPIGIVVAGVAVLGFVFKDFFSGVIGALLDVIQHWDVAWPLMKASALLQIQNLWERIKTFGINVVEIVQWLGRNWFNIIRDSVMLQLTVVQNLWGNIKGGWQALMDWFAGRPVTFEWTPLLDGFKATIEQLPELTKANVRKSTAEIDRLAAEFERRRTAKAATEEAKANDANADGYGSANFGAGGAPAAGVDKQKTEFIGLAQLAEKMQQEATKAALDKQNADAIQRNANAAEKLAQKADGDGLKVNVVAMNWQPSPDVAFG